MNTLTLLTKVRTANQLRQIEQSIKPLLEGLDVEAKILGIVADGWVQISLAGEDEGIAINYLTKEVGACPASLDNVKNFSTLNGYIRNLEKNREGLLIDVGVFQPKNVHATIPLGVLQAQLADGRKIDLKKLVSLFGFCEDLPVNIKITHLNEKESRVEAELSSKQIGKYAVWQESLLDRLIIVGSPIYQIKINLEKANLNRDVIDIERLGMLEYALTCKLGTDAAGLMPKIGKKLESARFTVFNPRRIAEFFETK